MLAHFEKLVKRKKLFDTSHISPISQRHNRSRALSFRQPECTRYYTLPGIFQKKLCLNTPQRGCLLHVPCCWAHQTAGKKISSENSPEKPENLENW